MNVIWFIVSEIWRATDRIFSYFGPFLATLPSKLLDKLKFFKMKKISGDILILHLRTANDDHMMYGLGNMEWYKENFLLFLIIFCHFIP